MTRSFVASGRVNLIGEHTDYNDGFRVHSIELDERIDIPIEEPFRKLGTWADYAAAVVAAVQDEHPLFGGCAIALVDERAAKTRPRLARRACGAAATAILEKQ